MIARALALLLALIVMVPPASGLGATQAASGAFSDTFDGTEGSTETPFSSPKWDVVIHSRDRGSWQQLEPMDVEHGADCSAPPAMHHWSGTPEGAVFLCRGHLMTAINGAGYGVVYLTPTALMDWSGGEAVLRFDISTFRRSNRDWMDFWVTPPEDNLVAPLAPYDSDLQG